MRAILRRLALIPVALLGVHFLAYAYAHIVRPLRAERTPYLFVVPPAGEPLIQAYLNTWRGWLQPSSALAPEAAEVGLARAALASAGLLVAALALGVLAGLALGLLGVQNDPPRVRGWLTSLSTMGLAMPSFYAGSLLVLLVFALVLRFPRQGLFLPVSGFGWDAHLVLPVLALSLRPAMQLARVVAGSLVEELGSQYVVAARSKGLGWQPVRWRHVLPTFASTLVASVASSLRLMVGELVLVEWLFGWPGLGHTLALTLAPSRFGSSLGGSLFLEPRLVAGLVALITAAFLLADLAAAALARGFDPRLRVETGEGHA